MYYPLMDLLESRCRIFDIYEAVEKQQSLRFCLDF